MRYEYATTPREKNNLALLPVGGSAGLYGVSGDGNLFQPGVLNGSAPVLDFAENGLFYKADKNNFAPVLGFAYDPFKDGKTSIRGGYRISYFQGSFNTIDATLDDNEGLILTTTRAFNTGFLRNGFGEAPLPAFSISAPQSIQTNSTVDIRAFDENLETPYVHDYTFGIQREIFSKTSLEVRYVGNRGRKLYRGYDINEVNIFAKDPRGTGQTFIEAFRVAQNNLTACRAVAACAATASFRYNAAIPGSAMNPLFETIFAAQTSSFTLSNFVTRLDEGRAGDFIDYLLRLRILNNERGGTFLSAVRAGQLPLNFFRANPAVRGAQLFANGSTSQYDSLQVELTRRLSSGLRVQANYTFAKGFSDFAGSTGDTNSFLTLTDTRREYAVITNTHQFSANFIYQLPFGGKEKFFTNAGGIPGYLLGGWQISSIIRYLSGDPLSITSGRGTYNTDARSASNTADVVGGLTREQLQGMIGLQRTDDGVFFINPNFAPGSTSDSSEVIFTNPQAGTIGSLGLASFFGPRNFNVDFSVLKRTRITEKVNVEFRGEIFNLLNTVNFDNPETNINSENFGKISNTVGRPRLMQFALRLNF